MNEMNLVKLIEVRTNKGELLCSLKIKEVRIESKEEKTNIFQEEELGKGDGNEQKESVNKDGNSYGKNDMMSYAQKRYIFRLLADQGIEGDEAHENLKERFQVDSLKEVTKTEASQVIEKLLEEQKGGDGHGSSK